MAEMGPSRTAQRVAAHRVEYARIDGGFGRPANAETLERDVAGDVEIRREGMHRYLEARTTFFDRCVVDAILTGVDQVVVLGAGYDGRSLRYARDGVRFFEVDLAATQHDKLARLKRLGVETSGVTFVPADFARDDVGSMLVAAGLDLRATLFALEGVVAYLDDATLRSLLDGIAAVAAPGSALAVSVGVDRDEADHDAADRAAAFRTAVDGLGEPVRSELAGDGARELLEACGWSPEASDLGGDGQLGLVRARRR
jgi:methyltransferase (TIGR00027 family)